MQKHKKVALGKEKIFKFYFFYNFWMIPI